MALSAPLTYTCRYCRARGDADGRLHAPNFWKGRTLDDFIKRIQCFFDNPTIARSVADHLITIEDVFGYDFTGYTIAPGGVMKMFQYVIADRRLLEHGSKMAKAAIAAQEMMNNFDITALYEALAIVAADDLHYLPSNVPATGVLRDGLQQTCDLCKGLSFADSATFQEHATGNRHLNSYFRHDTLCASCGWSAVGRGPYEHLSGRKHRSNVMDIFLERNYIVGVVDSASQASPAKKHKA